MTYSSFPIIDSLIFTHIFVLPMWCLQYFDLPIWCLQYFDLPMWCLQYFDLPMWCFWWFKKCVPDLLQKEHSTLISSFLLYYFVFLNLATEGLKYKLFSQKRSLLQWLGPIYSAQDDICRLCILIVFFGYWLMSGWEPETLY